VPAAILLVLGGWVFYVHVWGHGDDKRVRWVDFTHRFGELRFDHAGARLIHGGRTLRKFLNEHGSTPLARRPMPTFNWRHRDVVVVATGPRSAEGYEIQIVRIRLERRRLVVTVRERAPRLGRPQRAEFRYPYRLITIPKLERNLYVETLGRP
jgi:hypothetical protein